MDKKPTKWERGAMIFMGLLYLAISSLFAAGALTGSGDPWALRFLVVCAGVFIVATILSFAEAMDMTVLIHREH